MFLGILLLSLLGCSWTVIGCLDSFAAKRNANIPSILFYQALLTIVIGVIVMFVMKERLDWGNRQCLFLVAMLLLSGISAYLANVFLCLSMALGPNGIIWSIYQAAMMLPFLLGITLHHDTITTPRVIGIALLFTGLMALGIGGDLKKKKKETPDNTVENNTGHSATQLSRKRFVWLIPALLAFLTNGLCMYTLSLPSRFMENEIDFSSIARSTFLHLGLIIGSIVHGLFKKGIITIPTKTEGNLAVVFVLIGLVNYFALQFPGIDLLTEAGAGAIALTIPVGVCITAFTIYSALRLKEKYTPLEWIGLVACALGVITITC